MASFHLEYTIQLYYEYYYKEYMFVGMGHSPQSDKWLWLYDYGFLICGNEYFNKNMWLVTNLGS